MNFKLSLLVIPVALVMLFSEANAQSGSRGAAPIFNSAPVQSFGGSATRSFAAPVQSGSVTRSFAAPVQAGSATRSFSTPVQSFSAPVGSSTQSFAAPVQSFGAPVQTFSAPVQTFSQPVQSFQVAPVRSGWFGGRGCCGCGG